MNKLTLSMVAALVAGLPGQDNDLLIARFDKKIAESWVKNAEWITDFAVAKATAKKTGKPIFAYFTRSYAP